MIRYILNRCFEESKHDNLKPTYYSKTPYGREELSHHQTWYGLTALALVGGISLYLSIFTFYFQNKTTNSCDITTQTNCCCFTPLPEPPQVIFKQGKLALGTEVHLFSIPKPSPKSKIYIAGLKKDKDILDPDGLPEIESEDSPWVFPDTSNIHLSDKVLPDLLSFDIPEPEPTAGGEGEPEIICICHPEFPHASPFFLDQIQKDVDEEPYPINLREVSRLIKYPPLLRETSISGSMTLSVCINKKGRYMSHKIKKELHPLWTEEVVKHIEKVKFTPAIKEGKPVNYIVDIPFSCLLLLD